MSSPYVPVVERLRHILDGGSNNDDVFRRCRVLVWAGDKVQREPRLLGQAVLFMLGTTLLVDPGGIAPGLSGTLAMSPAWPSLKHAVRLSDVRAASGAELQARKEKSRMLLDYWIVVGGATLLEQVIGALGIPAVMPLWWLIKGMGAIWFLVSLSGAPVGRVVKSSLRLAPAFKSNAARGAAPHTGKPDPLNLAGTRRRNLPYPEPSPSTADESDSTPEVASRRPARAADRAALLSPVGVSSPAYRLTPLPVSVEEAVFSPFAPPSPPITDSPGPPLARSTGHSRNRSIGSGTSGSDYDEDPFADDFSPAPLSGGKRLSRKISDIVISPFEQNLDQARVPSAKSGAGEMPFSSASPQFFLDRGNDQHSTGTAQDGVSPAFPTTAVSGRPQADKTPAREGQVHRLSLDELLSLEGEEAAMFDVEPIEHGGSAAKAAVEARA